LRAHNTPEENVMTRYTLRPIRKRDLTLRLILVAAALTLTYAVPAKSAKTYDVAMPVAGNAASVASSEAARAVR
jgi:hypothetical protein